MLGAATGIGCRLVAAELSRAVDQSDKAECLRRVAEMAFQFGIVLFAEHSDVVAQGEKTLVECGRLVMLAHAAEGIDQPEAACKECAFRSGKSVVAFLRVVAQQEAVVAQVLANRVGLSPLGWWEFGDGAEVGGDVQAVSVPVLGWAIA